MRLRRVLYITLTSSTSSRTDGAPPALSSPAACGKYWIFIRVSLYLSSSVELNGRGGDRQRWRRPRGERGSAAHPSLSAAKTRPSLWLTAHSANRCPDPPCSHLVAQKWSRFVWSQRSSRSDRHMSQYGRIVWPYFTFIWPFWACK